MSLLNEFKSFAVKGNVIDMAVGIIIGAAFGKIVTSFVGDIMMPPIGLLLGGVDFVELKLVIQEASAAAPEVAIRYGQFIQTSIDFLIIGFALFIAIKAVNQLKKKEEVAAKAPPAPTKEAQLLTEIRDLLKNQ